MEIVIVIYVALLVIGGVVMLIRGQLENARFSRYMEEHHADRWRQMVYERPIRKALLWPFVRENVATFIWKSTEDYGDPQIRLFRQKLRWAFYGWIVYATGGIVGFALLAVMFEYWLR